MLGNDNKAQLPKVHCRCMPVSTKDMATTNTQLIHISMTNRTKRSHEQYTVELRHEKNITTNQYKVDLCDSKSTSMMTILESIKYSINLHHNLGM